MTKKQILLLLRNPVFLFITVIGNAAVMLFALAIYLVERGSNTMMESYFDAFYLAMTTITTVGYGDVHPVTTLGRILCMLLMVTGPGLFLTYIAMLSSLFSKLEVEEIEAEA
jgi:voltage-gated potassium channel